jgi:hypothetical protein
MSEVLKKYVQYAGRVYQLYAVNMYSAVCMYLPTNVMCYEGKGEEREKEREREKQLEMIWETMLAC